MPGLTCITKSGLLRLAYDLAALSLRITFAMIVAAFKVIIPYPMKSLLGETVLITGAAHGLGRELAIQLSSMGCIILCWDADVEGNRETIRAISENGGEAYGFALDVSKRIEVRETVRLMRRMGLPEVSILINNAAVLYHKPFLSHSEDDIEKTFQVNVLSHYWIIQAILPSMLQNNKGHIVSLSSMCGIYGVSQKVAYCSSKFAIRGLMEALHEEVRLSPKRAAIHFTTVYPFYIDTGLARDPKYRFPYVFGSVSPKYAARQVIRAIRRNYTEYAIPRCLFTLNAVNRIVPESVMRHILDFLANIDHKTPEEAAGIYQGDTKSIEVT